jgi:hypothetical protein
MEQQETGDCQSKARQSWREGVNIREDRQVMDDMLSGWKKVHDYMTCLHTSPYSIQTQISDVLVIDTISKTQIR